LGQGLIVARKVIDWETIRVHYSAGVKSVREIGAEFGVSHTMINKRAKQESWTRDLNAKIKAKADALVSKALVSSEVATETKITEQVTIEVEAQVQARIRLAHRQDIARNRSLVQKLMEELESVTDNRELFEQLGELLYAPDDKGNDKRYELYSKVISMAGRIDSAKKLVETLKVLVALEREAFGMDKGEGGAKGSFEDALKAALNG
jgi:chaperonin cofactor prefoldin